MLRITLLMALAAGGLHGAPGPEREAVRVEALLADMHPDYERYIREVRPAGTVATNVHLGLVRPGGRDPRRQADAPVGGHARRYDLIVFGTDERPEDGDAWARLLVDHEYFHARHLAHADGLPQPHLGPRMQRHLQEALAWGHSLERAQAGTYGALSKERKEEARRRYRSHRDSLRAFVLERQAAAWAYYGRFLPNR